MPLLTRFNMTKKNTLLLVLFFTFFVTTSYSQNFWNTSAKKEKTIKKKNILKRKSTPEKYTVASLNLNGFTKYLRNSPNSTANSSEKSREKIITLPNSEGKLERFSMKETALLAPKLAEKFPMIKSYTGIGIDDARKIVKISLGTNGVHAIISSADKETVYIDPYTKDKKQYIIYKTSDLKPIDTSFSCQVKGENRQKNKHENRQRTASTQKKNANDGQLRTYRIAIVCTAEYSLFHLNRQNVATSATDLVKKATVLSAINTSITRVNQIYERDLAVRMILVANNDELIFFDTNTDQLTNNNADDLIEESQVKCDAIIGNANYDIGHAFSTGGGGYAEVNSVCVQGYKAQGLTGSYQPINDPYDIDYVCHELGHQFGATHTQNNDCNRTSSTAVEPGSGSTIMGYANICAPNVQTKSDPYFHAVSIDQMWSHIQGNGNCAVLTPTNNDAPIANAGTNYSIPKGTPFLLKGSATDKQGTASLTYNWEQTDTQIAPMPPVATSTGGPTFKSVAPSKSANRYFPDFENVINKTTNQWIVLPTVERELNFAFTVRDNNPNGGSSDRDNIKITLTDALPFTVTAPNTNIIWDTGATKTITWQKGTSDIAPINCKKVTIKLSTDGGKTFPILLKENTLNDGTEEITIPDTPTTQARILIEASDNVFYNVNDSNFTINATKPTFLLSNKTPKQNTCKNSDTPISYTFNANFINGFTETINLSATGLPNGTSAVFTPNSLNSSGDVTLTINNFKQSNQKEYTIVVQGKSATITQTNTAFLNIIDDNLTKTILKSPVNLITETSLTPDFNWSKVENASAYQLIVASNSDFSTIIIDETVNTNSYTPTTPLLGTTTYFWRVKPKNNCKEGTFSSDNQFTTQAPSYCSSTFIDDAGGKNHITNVSFNSINNTSGNDTIDGYEDFTNIITEVEKTVSYQMNVTFDSDGYQDHCFVFIDWNQDLIFDKITERYDIGSGSQQTLGQKITIPENAILGFTRMRVLLEYDDPTKNYGEGACTSEHLVNWGETEDYTLKIIEKPRPSFTINNTSGNLSICNTAVDTQIFTLKYEALQGFNENIVFSAIEIPANTTANFSTIDTNGLVKVTLSNLKNAPVGDYNFKIIAKANSMTKQISIPFNINDTICKSAGNMDSNISTTLVNFADINSISEKSAGYSKYTNTIAELIRGTKYPLIVKANSDGKQTVKTTAWIDWNQNCLFDANEKYDLGTATNANASTSKSGLEIIIPNNALNGKTTLRIITEKVFENTTKNTIDNKCVSGFNGEVEDYTIAITPSFTLTNQTKPIAIYNKAVNEVQFEIDYETINGFNQNVTLSTEDNPKNTPENTNISFNPIIKKDGTFTVNINNLNEAPVGDYTIKIIATAGEIQKSVDLKLNVNDSYCKAIGNATSQTSITKVMFAEIDNSSTKTTGYSDFKTINTPVVRGENYELTIKINNQNNENIKTYGWIDWNQNLVFEDNEIIDLEANNTSITIPEDAEIGATVLRIAVKKAIEQTANSCEFGFDGEVEDYTINIQESFATYKNLFTDLQVFPVPSDGKLTVKFKVKIKEVTVIRLFNALGQLLETQTFSTISTRFEQEVQFKKISSGNYFLQIENDGKLKTRKIIIQ